MNAVRSLRGWLQGNPRLMQTVNGWLTLFWIAMIPISIWTGWVKSITYVSALSLWALVSGHWSTWQASRVEVHQQEDADVQEVLDVVKGQERPGRPDPREALVAARDAAEVAAQLAEEALDAYDAR